MRPSLLRRVVAGLAALALLVAPGLEAAHVAHAMSPNIDAIAAVALEASASDCELCDTSGESTATRCQPICAPSVAVLPAGESITHLSLSVSFQAEDMMRIGRMGAPEPHPPKSIQLN